MGIYFFRFLECNSLPLLRRSNSDDLRMSEKLSDKHKHASQLPDLNVESPPNFLLRTYTGYRGIDFANERELGNLCTANITFP